MLGTLLALLLVDIGSDVRRLVSLLGVVVFVLFGLAFSRHPRQVSHGSCHVDGMGLPTVSL